VGAEEAEYAALDYALEVLPLLCPACGGTMTTSCAMTGRAWNGHHGVLAPNAKLRAAVVAKPPLRHPPPKSGASNQLIVLFYQ